MTDKACEKPWLRSRLGSRTGSNARVNVGWDTGQQLQSQAGTVRAVWPASASRKDSCPTIPYLTRHWNLPGWENSSFPSSCGSLSGEGITNSKNEAILSWESTVQCFSAIFNNDAKSPGSGKRGLNHSIDQQVTLNAGKCISGPIG